MWFDQTGPETTNISTSADNEEQHGEKRLEVE